jgi:CPA1 family monovalent cation:H+ antiporter
VSIGLDIERIEVLLLIAAIVAMLARRLRLPYTVGLVVAGFALAIAQTRLRAPLTRDLIFTAFLPPLIFEAALRIPASQLRRELPLVGTLATLGVAISALVTGAGVHYAAGWSWDVALLFGSLIAATDPVSVIALMREVGASGRLRLMTEAESLLNDGTAAVIFGVVLAMTQRQTITFGGVLGSLLLSIVGGLMAGAIVGAATLLLAGRTEDHLLEITLTTVAAYGSFLVANSLGVSGVLATLACGVMIGNVTRLGPISSRGRVAVESFWEYAAFAVNSLVFLLIGMSEAGLSFARVLGIAGAAIAFVLLGRAAAVYSCCTLFRASPLRVSARYQHLLVWGGLRGALALALALGLPRHLSHRQEVVTVAFAVVAFSVVVQGLTVPSLMRLLGELPSRREPRA